MPTTISVHGEAEHRVAPELAAVALSVGASGPDREDVAARTAAAHARLLAGVRELEASGALERWTSDQLRAWSYRPWSAEGESATIVHQASADVEVVFRDLARVGEWLGEAAASEELTIGGVDWRLSDASRASARESAQRAAVADALDRAAVYASALGLGAPVIVELSDRGMPPATPVAMRAFKAMASDGGGQPTEFAPQELVISASVDARFEAEAR
ncbi:SIMPL domain-containing protein [Agromyces salentinus]|uniref:DUF541 domain-containing protein n=1 Tax=Agromyces salentinus TaxID=269421 RepID=A0ABN2MP33_9MICO|nr:SIMPL domain-containing protein [Agromyces salentinus]